MIEEFRYSEPFIARFISKEFNWSENYPLITILTIKNMLMIIVKARA